jgi:hypothetical protein
MVRPTPLVGALSKPGSLTLPGDGLINTRRATAHHFIRAVGSDRVALTGAQRVHRIGEYSHDGLGNGLNKSASRALFTLL